MVKTVKFEDADDQGLTISLEVEDIETMYSLMKESGLNPPAVNEIWKSGLFNISESEGNRIEFWA